MQFSDLNEFESMSQRQKEITVESIKLISDKGIDSLTIKNISQAMGLTEMALYRHFKSKADIIQTILTIFQAKMHGIVETLIAKNLPPVATLTEFTQTYFSTFNECPWLTSLLFAHEIFLLGDREILLTQIIEQMLNRIGDVVSSGQKQQVIRSGIPVESLSLVFLGTLRTTILRWHLSRHQRNLIKDGDAALAGLMELIRA